MSAGLGPAIRFEIWSYSTLDGGGYALICRPECCEHRPGEAHADGVFTVTTRVAAYNVDAVETTYRARWNVPVNVRYCACGCLRGTDAANRPIYRDGQIVTYHGSLIELHGPAYYFGPCWCGVNGHADCGGAELETSSGQVMHHVRYSSFH